MKKQNCTSKKIWTKHNSNNNIKTVVEPSKMSFAINVFLVAILFHSLSFALPIFHFIFPIFSLALIRKLLRHFFGWSFSLTIWLMFNLIPSHSHACSLTHMNSLSLPLSFSFVHTRTLFCYLSMTISSWFLAYATTASNQCCRNSCLIRSKLLAPIYTLQ